MTELPQSAARALNVRCPAFRASAWRKFNSVPEEGTMLNQFRKIAAVKTCALACIAGLTLNTFAFAQNPSPTPARSGMSPAKDNQARQADQGRQYGQSGFVGEPINLNVVNADIRDILNYITEQYGINFVIDSSVGAVPVTVNVQDVPWNLALDMILRSNKLGVQVNGNILRIATVESLAKEAETERVINDARLENTQLVTEFIRLNYARASGVLSGAGGASANFAGGAIAGLSLSG